MPVTINNTLLMNPVTGHPYYYEDPKIDRKGKPVHDEEGNIVFLEPKEQDLFDSLLRILRVAEAKDVKVLEMQKYSQVAKKVRAARSTDGPMDHQFIELGNKRFTWLQDQVESLVFKVFKSREFVDVLYDAMGFYDDDNKEDD